MKSCLCKYTQSSPHIYAAGAFTCACSRILLKEKVFFQNLNPAELGNKPFETVSKISQLFKKSEDSCHLQGMDYRASHFAAPKGHPNVQCVKAALTHDFVCGFEPVLVSSFCYLLSTELSFPRLWDSVSPCSGRSPSSSLQVANCTGMCDKEVTEIFTVGPSCLTGVQFVRHLKA